MTRALLACLIASGLAGACARPAPRRVAVATVRQPATALFFVAQASRCFEREGLAVEEHPFELGRDALVLLGEGRADVAIAYETPFLAAARADPSLRILSALHSSTRNTRLVARPSAGIREVSDLAGKRIGLAPGTNAEFFLGLALEYGGVPRADVRIAELSPEESAAALGAGAIDGAVLSDPAATRAEAALGDAAVVRSNLYVEYSLLVAREETIERRRPELEALLRGLACGERLARERPEEALARIRGRFPELSEPELRAQVRHVSWGIGLDHLLADVLRREGEWLQARAPGAPPAPPSRLMDLRLLEAVEPDAVMLMPRPPW